MHSITADIDQCLDDNGGCSQNCTNLLPGYECSCEAGYLTENDGFDCTGEDEGAQNQSGIYNPKSKTVKLPEICTKMK